MSTVGMESITPEQNQYWCWVDEYMESGDIDDLCPEALANNNESEIPNDTNVFLGTGENDVVATDCNMNTSHGNNLLSTNSALHYFPVDECMMKNQFTVEECLLM